MDDSSNPDKFFHDYLTVQAGRRYYSCVYCGLQLALEDDIESRNYVSNARRAFMISRLINVYADESTNRWAAFNSGEYFVCDIFCKRCDRRVATKYLDAGDSAYAYKVGKYLVSRQNLCKERMNCEVGGRAVSSSFKCRNSLSYQGEQESSSHSTNEANSDLDPEEIDPLRRGRHSQRQRRTRLQLRSKSCIVL